MKVNNDTPVEVAGSDEPGIKTNEIETKRERDISNIIMNTIFSFHVSFLIRYHRL